MNHTYAKLKILGLDLSNHRPSIFRFLFQLKQLCHHDMGEVEIVSLLPNACRHDDRGTVLLELIRARMAGKCQPGAMGP